MASNYAERDRENIDTYCAPPMIVSDFRTSAFIKVGEDILTHRKVHKTDQELADEMGLTLEVYKELSECCDPKHLQCEDEGPYINGDCMPSELPEDLAVHRFLKEDNGRGVYINLTRYVKYYDTVTEDADIQDPNDESKDMDSSMASEGDKIDDTEILLSVAIYHNRRRKKDQEYLVVSRQSLTALKDVIVCQTDHAPTKDCSEDPDTQGPVVKRAHEIYKSGYFFIEGVFYNDMRDAANIDYSKVVIDWAKSGNRWQNPRLGIFRSKKMEDTTFEDIKFRLGAPYLYCHQGDCEHLMFITDMRIIADFDPKRFSDYPALTCRESKIRRKCSVCNLLTAKWLTRYDELAFEDPSFFCDACFEYLHYDVKKRKICDFQAFPYEKKICK